MIEIDDLVKEWEEDPERKKLLEEARVWLNDLDLMKKTGSENMKILEDVFDINTPKENDMKHTETMIGGGSSNIGAGSGG